MVSWSTGSVAGVVMPSVALAAIDAGADAFVSKRELTLSLLPIVQKLMQRN